MVPATTKQNNNANTRIINTYDSLGRKTQTIDPDSGTWKYAYDAAGNLIYQDDPKSSASNPPSPQSVQFTYDQKNRVTNKYYLATDAYCTVPSQCTPTQQITYAYDAGSNGIGRLTSVTDPSGGATFTYDPRGRVIATSKTITVNAVAKTATTNFAYDAADHVTVTQYPDSESVVTCYDHGGQARATGLSANCPTTTYVSSIWYDLFGRPTAVVHGNTTDNREYYGPPGSNELPQRPSPQAAVDHGR